MDDAVLILLTAIAAGVVVGAVGYIAACAGAERWLTFREWW
jgi:hypothetical protein